MALSFAGTRLTVPTPEAAAWVETNITTRDLYPWDVMSRVSSVRVGLTTTGQLDCRPVRLNVLRWPVGACEWATCYLLASTGQLGEILGKVYTDASIGTGTLLMSGPRGDVQTEMYLLPPRPLAQLPGANGMWLLPLVDERYFWWQKTTGDLKAAPPTSWADWITLLGPLVGTTLRLTRDTPSTYIYPDGARDLGLSYVDLAPVLDSVAFNIGCRVVRGLDGSVTLQDPLDAAASQQSQWPQGWPVLAGGKLPLPAPGQSGPVGLRWWNPAGSAYSPWSPPLGGTAAGVIPEKVEVTFPTSGDSSTLVALDATPASTGQPDLSPLNTGPGTKTFRSGVDTSHSSSSRQAMTNQLATDWYRWQLGQLDVVFAGVVPWGPEGFDDIEWSYRSDLVATRVCRLPYNDLREELLGGGGTAAAAAGGTPLIKVTSASTQSITLTGGSTTGYPAVTEIWSSATGAWSDGSACWFVPANGETPTNGQRYEVEQIGHDASDVAVYSTHLTTGGGGGTLTVDYTDESSPVGSVTDLEFDKHYFTISTPLGGNADITLGPISGSLTFVSGWGFVISAAGTVAVNAPLTLNGSSYALFSIPIVLGPGGFVVQTPNSVAITVGNITNDLNSGGYEWILLTGSGTSGSIVTGFVAPALTGAIDGRLLKVTNLTNQPVEFTNADTGSAAGNRIVCLGSGDPDGVAEAHTLYPDETAWFKYRAGTTNAWLWLEKLPHYSRDMPVAGTALNAGQVAYRSRLNFFSAGFLAWALSDDHVNDTVHVTANLAAGYNGGRTGTNGINRLTVDFSTTSTTFVSTGLSVTLPAAGTYRVLAVVEAEADTLPYGSVGNSNGLMNVLLAKLRDVTAGVDLPNSKKAGAWASQPNANYDPVLNQETVVLEDIYTVTGATIITLYIASGALAAPGTSPGAVIAHGGNPGYTTLSFIRLD